MRIMNGDRIVARSAVLPNTQFPVFVAEPDATCWDLPLPLFGFTKRQVTGEEFVKWVSERCFPEDRVDKDDVLKALGLKKYDPWEIVKITKGVLYGIDDFWVDFDNT